MMQYGVQAMYVRVKREETTYFVSVEKQETVLELKQKLQKLCSKSPDQVRLINIVSGDELADAKKLQELKIQSDDVLGLCFQLEDGGFEDVKIKEYDEFEGQ
eukprot:TRINITY_DN41336_c1_g2_i1.p5 TRINITY_DN41336_c1_g2~~TRINITY_DN41336_c1_g2_i1.p5  ORF type:complete len:102 (-),score=17.74 TRINITY_DN41336_c1_g2_i1:744-1049(-)